MHIVLLSGGAGKRLWPLSNELRSKLFIKLLPSPAGGLETMIGRVCRQLESLHLLDSTLIISHQDQANITALHTKGLIPVIGEPFKRGTFTAAALAALYLQSSGMAEDDDTICIAPADVFVGEDFFSSFKRLPEILNDSDADIALLGTRPTHASDQYGYVVPVGIEHKNGYLHVAQFMEKPEIRMAESLLHRGALWNCGVYAFSLSFMLTQIKEAGLPAHYDELVASYEHLPERSFDKQVAERTKRAIVLPFQGIWQDIGSWEALSAQLDSNVFGQGTISGQSSNSHIINELSLPIHVIGVPGIIAAASPDGILIANKKNSNDIKDQLGSQPLQPMYGEATWGSYRVVDRFTTEEDTTVTVLNVSVMPGKNIGLREHRSGHKAWTVLTGSGQVLLDGQIMQVAAGTQFAMTLKGFYSILAETQMIVLETRISGPEGEDSVFFDAEDWEKIIEHAEIYKDSIHGS